MIDRDNLLEKTRTMGGRLLSLLEDRFGDHPNVGDIRGRGLFVGIELVSDVQTKAGFKDRPSLAEELRLGAMKHGLIIYPGSINIDGLVVPHILLAPPMVVEDRHLLECADKLALAVNGVLGLEGRGRRYGTAG